MLGIILLQVNANSLLQLIGLSVLQAIFQAPIYFFAVYWAIKQANKSIANSIKSSHGENK